MNRLLLGLALSGLMPVAAMASDRSYNHHDRHAPYRDAARYGHRSHHYAHHAPRVRVRHEPVVVHEESVRHYDDGYEHRDVYVHRHTYGERHVYEYEAPRRYYRHHHGHHE